MSSNHSDDNHAEKGQGGASMARNVTPGGHPLDSTQPAFPIYHRKLANPAPLGLCGFALTTFVLSLINLRARGSTIPQVVIGSAFFYGGLAQLIAGVCEFCVGNTFGFTAFCSYGAFWLSYAWTISPWSGVASSYASAPAGEFTNGLGYYLAGWFIFTFIMFTASLKSSVSLVSVFFFLTITFLLLMLGEFFRSIPALPQAGGAFGIITAFLAWYTAAAGLLQPDTSYFVLPTGPLTRG